MKRFLKWLAIVIGGLIALVIIASIVLMLIINKDMIAQQAEKVLNRHVTIESIDVSIFSVLSGIEVKGVAISNFKTPQQLSALKGKPVDKADLFAGLDSFTFKLKILPLLQGKFELRELLLSGPKVNIVRYKSGAFNFSDLMKPSTKEEKKVEEVKKEEPSKPLTADTLPVSITIGRIGIEKGTVTFTDQSSGQKVMLYNCNALVHNIEIDPKDLKNKNQVKLTVDIGIKTIGKTSTGSVESFDIGLSAKGNVKPFDLKTRILNPEIALKAGSPYGTMTGLQIFDAIKSNETLANYAGKFDFLAKDVKWKNGYIDIWYKGGLLKITNGKISTDDYAGNFKADINLNTSTVNADIDMILNEKHNKSIYNGIKGNASKLIKGDVAKYVKPENVADQAFKYLTNKDGKVYLKFAVTGPMNKPKTKLVEPKLPSLNDIIKDMAGDVVDVAKEKAVKKVSQTVEKTTDKAKDKATKKLKKLF
ncbi:MAG TPA: AsmA family protein [Spirochaetota bacterium]|nr:AsmA family protein [Spirochaetota bacterium]HOM88103.1 AsmA family protein [Spirochaetota bacterium]HPD04090.1 AsmA family protein [Spirochaetota bacterium]HQG43924.1 AsmA family protein [Spirochaetota bacterium]HQI37084.1 AsmA family protein [Spirochaetota bacterium]